MVDEAAARARDDGWTVVAGHCVRLGETSLSYAPLMELLRELRDQVGTDRLTRVAGDAAGGLAHLFSGPGGGSDGRFAPGALSQEQIFWLMHDLLSAVADEGRLLLVVEDLHWADPSTADLFVFLARTLRRRPVVLAATVRTDDPPAAAALGPLLSERRRSPSCHVLDLAALGRTDLADLAALTERTLAPGELDDLLARTGGIPFVAEQLLAAGAPGGPIPATLRDMVRERARGLSDAALGALRLAAVAGERVDHAVLAAASSYGSSGLDAALGALTDRGLLVVTSSGFRFRHALVREVVTDQLLPGERAALHRRLAEALAGLEGDDALAAPDRSSSAALAHHWEQAGDLSRALAARCAAAGDDEAAGAYSAASGHYERALRLWDRVPDPQTATGIDHAELRARAGDAAGFVPDVERAVRHLRAAIDSIDDDAEPLRAALVRNQLGHHLWDAGLEREALRVGQEAADLVGGLPPSTGKATVLAQWAVLSMVAGDPGDAERAGEQALALAEATGADGARCNALSALGACLTARGALDRGLAAQREALVVAARLGDGMLQARTHLNLSNDLFLAGRLDEAVDVALAGTAVVRRTGLFRTKGLLLLSNAAEAQFELGRWDECGRTLAEIDEAEPVAMIEGFVASLAAGLAVGQGRLDDADGHLGRARSLLHDTVAAQSQLPAATVEATVALARGAPDEARATVDAALADPGAGTGAAPPVLLGLLLVGVRAEVERVSLAHHRQRGTEAAEALAAAQGLVDAARDSARDHGSPLVAATLATIEAELTRAAGAPDAAAWADAVAANDAVGRAHEAAVARARRAEALLARPGGRDEATADLQAALATAHRMAARPLSDDIVALARRARLDLAASIEAVADAGASVATDGTGVAGVAGRGDTAGLTTRELDVLRLVADGRTNPEIARALFISRKTASNHISHILTKLGVTNRVEAAGAGRRLGLVADE